MIGRLEEYRNKLEVLRQIMSNKVRTFSHINTAANMATVVVSSFLTFMGFAGLVKLHAWINLFYSIEMSTVELIFNLFVFGLFVLVILHLVFRFGSKQFEAERAIVMLTHLLNEIDDIIAKAEHIYCITISDVDIIRNRYETLTQVLPPNSDKEFLRAKKDRKDKILKKMSLNLSAKELFTKEVQHRTVQAILQKSTTTMNILSILRTTDQRLYLGGGLIRNLVWDHLHGYSLSTPIEDVDIIYFDEIGCTKEHDKVIEQKLKVAIPNLKWSVKNQARMHDLNNDPAYTSLIDAVAKWPETATAILAKLTPEGEIELIAPFGFSDLFRLIVCPTLHFRNKLDRYRSRIERKQWGKHWPLLRFFDLD